MKRMMTVVGIARGDSRGGRRCQRRLIPRRLHRSKSGGTLNVGWEQSFGVTDNFDPTGEYLGDAWGVLDT